MSDEVTQPATSIELHSARLRLFPFAPAQVLALIAGEADFARATGFQVDPGLRSFFVGPEVSADWLHALKAAASQPADPWVHGFAVVLKSESTAIGTAAFKGPPTPDGSVEIAYAVAPRCQGQGIATEAAGLLLAFCQQDSRVRQIRAHTAPQRNASTSVLTKLGFVQVGTCDDPDDGLVWRWEKDLA